MQIKKKVHSEGSSYSFQDKEIDENKIKLFYQLIRDNSFLRKLLHLQLVNYPRIETINYNNIDDIISNLLDDNESMKKQLYLISDSKERIPFDTHEMFIDLDGNHSGCSFWMPLKNFENNKKIEKNYFYNKENNNKISKFEKTILMISRIPNIPFGNLEIIKNSDEYLLINSFLIEKFKNNNFNILKLIKSGYHNDFINLERNFNDIRILFHISNNNFEYFENKISNSILLTFHTKFILKELKKKETISFLICSLSLNNLLNNQYFSNIPDENTLNDLKNEFDTLKIQFKDQISYLNLKNNVIPLYYIEINKN